MDARYVSVNLDEILVGEPLPATLYQYIDSRYITFRVADDQVDRDTFLRLEAKKVNYLFIKAEDLKKFENWKSLLEPPPTAQTEETKALYVAREDAHREESAWPPPRRAK